MTANDNLMTCFMYSNDNLMTCFMTVTEIQSLLNQKNNLKLPHTPMYIKLSTLFTENVEVIQVHTYFIIFICNF